MTRNNWRVTFGMAALLGLWMLPAGIAWDDHEDDKDHEGELVFFDDHKDGDEEDGEHDELLLVDDHEDDEDGEEHGELLADDHEDDDDGEHEGELLADDHDDDEDDEHGELLC